MELAQSLVVLRTGSIKILVFTLGIFGSLLSANLSFAQAPSVLVTSIKTPADVRCIVVTVAGGRTVKHLFDMIPGQAAVLTMKGLPLGDASVSEEAFEGTCGTLTAANDANWFSDPVLVTLVAGSAAKATITLQRNGRLIITSQFVSESETAPGNSSLPECRVQRVVHLVAGNGGLAWFTLLWPPTDTIRAPNPDYANDGPSNFVPISDGGVTYYARYSGGIDLKSWAGTNPLPTMFVAGARQQGHVFDARMTHDPPVGSNDILMEAVLGQKNTLQPPVPVISFRQGDNTLATITPDDVVVSTIDEAISRIRTVALLTSPQEEDLRPSPAKLATWTDSNLPQNQIDLAEKLIFAANAFRMGLASTVLMPALEDDPHHAFVNGLADVSLKANGLARILTNFYSELAGHAEPSCSHAGKELSLADNVAMIISGDTPKNPFKRKNDAGMDDWSDDPPGLANVIYFRSNGFLWSGWYGDMTASGSSLYAPDGQGSVSDPGNSLKAAQIGMLFAILRGQKNGSPTLSSYRYSYDSLIRNPPP